MKLALFACQGREIPLRLHVITKVDGVSNDDQGGNEIKAILHPREAPPNVHLPALTFFDGQCCTVPNIIGYPRRIKGICEGLSLQ